MLIPEQAKTAFVLYYTLGTDTKELSYRFTTDQKTWLAGEKYVYRINVSTQEITVDPSVTEWGVPFKNYTISAVSKAYTPSRGTASVEYTDVNKATIKAEAVAGFEFYRWLNVDGSGNILGISTENPHQVVAAGDSAYIAQFIPDEGVIAAAFSVSATEQVVFTNGNLKWDGSAFSTESSQTTYPKSWDASHVGHFFYSKDAEKAYAATYSDGGISTSDVFFTNDSSDQTKPNSSFTCNGMTGVFRTLTGGDSGEFKYLIDTRTVKGETGFGNTCQWVSVSGTNGLIIYPDNYSGTLFTNGQAITIPEDCVFLPAAGARIGSSIGTTAGSYGYYWFASPNESIADFAYFLTFYRIYVYPDGYDGRHGGNSVRLVSEL